MSPRVLHITCDYPDTVQKCKTRAVSNLINSSSSLEHIVLSMNRVSQPFSLQSQGNLFSITYPGLPMGMLMKRSLAQAADRLIPLLDFQFNVVHTHKFSIEGLIGARIAKVYEKPLIITVRGHTDLNIMRAKPHYRSLYRRIAGQAAHIFFLAPWTYEAFQKTIGALPSSFSFLPNITRIPPKSATQISDRFVTTVNYDTNVHKAKNIDVLLRAFRHFLATPGHAHFGLDIYTTPSLIPADIRRMVSSPALSKNIQIKNILPNREFVATLPSYVAFVRPSYPETFGMVYIESLLSGVPVMHSQKTAIDGYFKEYDFIKKVRPHSIKDITVSLLDLADRQTEYKNLLNYHIRQETFTTFLPKSIIWQYEDTIKNIIHS